ncbi:Catalase HPII [Usitatibacter rugosus]|uniref:Catalase n=1 Tax=Usitatibacter rugosus TaxID=2732067 RepID=A0A6M4GRH3_9PROT|nr:catalase [Usitatibacter rugosus]QJR09851.1 Catalase HPII [Usitatibacter rugosus]
MATKKAAGKTTAGGPARGATPPGDAAARKAAATQKLAAAFPFNANKPNEIGEQKPKAGVHAPLPDPSVGASTLMEGNSTGKPQLEAARIDAEGAVLTTNFGAPVADNQNSLKAGLRGPTLLEDFILREKITHFDHERIPERIVHARGSGAHGYFECYDSLARFTRAEFLSAKGKRTPVFVRFSTVAGERGSTDTPRDVRGFATKFYTGEGNFDIVGNNIPVFFIQDAMKFPDLVHAVKPEPHNGMPQAASAHDTFWDFVSLMPETTHMLMWVMSDRALPRSLKTMQGFGVHTFRFVNAKDESRFVKFHWNPVAGTHSLDWDECIKISGADSDFHRRDLWESIEAGVFPEWELGVQVFTEAQAEKYSFDVLDATKIVPEELVPVVPVGRMVLDRNPDNFFAETEQVAFGVQNLVPGIDFSNDPLLAGRIHSYFDTQLSRLGGPNFHEIPINAPVAPANNNQRDGIHRHAVNRGRVAYEPNSLGGGCPFQAGAAGFRSFPQPMEGDKVRGKPERFADHYSQATLFWNSQTEYEKAHIVRAFRFELTKVTVPAIRERTLSMLRNVTDELAGQVAEGLGMALPRAMPKLVASVKVEVQESPALSLTARPGNGDLRGRHVAILVAPGVDAKSVKATTTALQKEGVVVHTLAARLGDVAGKGGTITPDGTLETMPSVLHDGVVVPDGEEGADELGSLGQALEFLKDQYRHAKPILMLGAGRAVLEEAGIPVDDDTDWAIASQAASFIDALRKHRHWDRQIDPPPI